jgi:hypothetical protein
MAHIITATNFGKLLRAMIAALDRFAPLMSPARMDVPILGSMLPGLVSQRSRLAVVTTGLEGDHVVMRGDGGRCVRLADPGGLLPGGRAPHISASAVDQRLQASLDLEVNVLKVIQDSLSGVQYLIRALGFLAVAE